MTTNNKQLFIVHCLVAMLPIAMWPLGCVCDDGNAREGICLLTRVVMGAHRPLWYAFAGVTQ
jgi:hypothetical protein